MDISVWFFQNVSKEEPYFSSSPKFGECINKVTEKIHDLQPLQNKETKRITEKPNRKMCPVLKLALPTPVQL